VERSHSSFEPLADDLVAQNVDLIVAVGSPATRAVKERTTRIPIVIVDVGDPVAYGLMQSLARPGSSVLSLLAETLPASSARIRTSARRATPNLV
jgi:putative ABC transport system substrate-binding protein